MLNKKHQRGEYRLRAVETWLDQFGTMVWAVDQIWHGAAQPPVNVFEDTFIELYRHFSSIRRFPSARSAVLYYAIQACAKAKEPEFAENVYRTSTKEGDLAKADVSETPGCSTLWEGELEAVRRLTETQKWVAVCYLFHEGDMHTLTRTLFSAQVVHPEPAERGLKGHLVCFRHVCQCAAKMGRLAHEGPGLSGAVVCTGSGAGTSEKDVDGVCCKHASRTPPARTKMGEVRDGAGWSGSPCGDCLRCTGESSVCHCEQRCRGRRVHAAEADRLAKPHIQLPRACACTISAREPLRHKNRSAHGDYKEQCVPA